jgi:hypothetical protein
MSAESIPAQSSPATPASPTAVVPGPLTLTAYPISEAEEWSIVPASPKREWMDATDGKFAYRCLPLVMANQAGWWVTCPCDFRATWNGGALASDTKVTFADGKVRDYVASHFGTGILTFGMPWLFQTSPGWGLWARGPSNWIKDNCVALDGIIETDWAPYTFTMNWRIMRRNVDVYFRKGEPICQLVPYPLAAFEGVQPEFRQLPSNPGLLERYAAFRMHKNALSAKSAQQGKGAFSMDYSKGVVTGTQERAREHRTGFSVAGFEGEGDLAADYRTK